MTFEVNKYIDKKEPDNESQNKKFFDSSYLGCLFLIIIVIAISLINEISRENNIFTTQIMSGAKTFYIDKEYSNGKYVVATGAWNVTYKTNVEIRCDYYEKLCTQIQASIYPNTSMLDVIKTDYKINHWDNNHIQATDKGTQYLYELNINLNNEDVTLTKHPLSKKGILGNNLETSTFKLYDGWKVDMNNNDKLVKKTNWFKIPIIKTINFLFPLKEEHKIDIL